LTGGIIVARGVSLTEGGWLILGEEQHLEYFWVRANKKTEKPGKDLLNLRFDNHAYPEGYAKQRKAILR